jgi:hypothetical protein
MSQIVDYDDTDLEKLSLYARNLRPMLRETLLDEDDIDLGNEIARRLGVKPQWEKIDFTGLIAALTSGRVDVLITAMTKTPDRAAWDRSRLRPMAQFVSLGVLVRKFVTMRRRRQK